MCARSLFEHLPVHPPSFGPEWGSGGIFGLKYHRGVLYYTLAMDAQSYFLDSDGIRQVYKFEKVGPQPVSGGDTYNAVEAVDDRIYFGGWVHAPAVYKGRLDSGAVIDFSNKYSHMHFYDIDNDKVEVLWKESLHHPEKWACEVSEIVYNSYRNELLVARADGHENFGVFAVDPRSGRSRRIIEGNALKGALHLEYACFALNQHPRNLEGIACIDLIEEKHFVKKIHARPVDGWPASGLWAGPVASAYGWLFSFVRGGLILGDIFNDEYYFVRLFDIPGSQFGPTRTKSIVLGGGILVAFNSFTYHVLKIITEEEREWRRLIGSVISPSLLLYFVPPEVRVVATLGGRITSMESVGDRVVLGTNTMANTQRYDASPFDQGTRSFVVLNHDSLINSRPSVSITVPGSHIGLNAFGGIPLTHFEEPKIVIYSSKENTIHISEYFLTIPPTIGETDKAELKRGKNIIDLSNYTGIVSFKPEKALDDGDMVIFRLR